MPEYYTGEYASYVLTEKYFYDRLIQIEADRIILEAFKEVRLRQGFAYLRKTAMPVVPYNPNAFVPPGVLEAEARREIALQRTNTYSRLVENWGGENVWVGPQVRPADNIPGLSESEQRGFWVRESPELQ